MNMVLLGVAVENVVVEMVVVIIITLDYLGVKTMLGGRVV